MVVKNMWSPEELDELRIIFQDIEDMGYTCYKRQIGQIIIWKNIGDSPGEIKYTEEFYNSLCEAIDRLLDMPYKLHKIYYEIKLKGDDGKFFGRNLKKYDYPVEPENFNIIWKQRRSKAFDTSDDIANFIEIDLSPNRSPEKALVTIEINVYPKSVLKRIKSFIDYVD